MFLQVLVMRALTWESSCIIANTFGKTLKNLFSQDIYQHHYKVHKVHAKTLCLLIVITLGIS